MGRIHKKDLGLLKLDQQIPAVQLILLASSLEATEVDKSCSSVQELSTVESPVGYSLSVLRPLRSAMSFLTLQPLTNNSSSLQIMIGCF